jgi:hypothetical protein
MDFTLLLLGFAGFITWVVGALNVVTYILSVFLLLIPWIERFAANVAGIATGIILSTVFSVAFVATLWLFTDGRYMDYNHWSIPPQILLQLTGIALVSCIVSLAIQYIRSHFIS